MPDDSQHSGRPERAEELARELSLLRDRLEGRPEGERVAALRSALDKALDASPPAAVESLAQDLRVHLVAQVRGRQQRLRALEGQVETLEARAALADELAQAATERDQAAGKIKELEAAKAGQDSALQGLGKERDALHARVQTLEAELLEQKQVAQAAQAAREEALAAAAQPRPAAPAALIPDAPPPLPSGPPRATLLQTLRGGLRDSALGQDVSPESLELPDDVARFFQLVQQLLRFALEFDRGVQAFLMELQIGPAMDTIQVRSYHRQVEQSFCDCLEEKEGSIESLKELLDRNRRFLILLNESYRAAIPRGAETLLEELSPERVLGNTKSKGLLRLTNYEDAYKELSGLYDDLRGLPPSETMTRYFTEVFQAELRRRV